MSFSEIFNEIIEKNSISKNNLVKETEIECSTFYGFLGGRRLPTREQFARIISCLKKKTPNETPGNGIAPEDVYRLQDSFYMERLEPSDYNLWKQTKKFILSVNRSDKTVESDTDSAAQIRKFLENETVSESGNSESSDRTEEIDIFLPLALIKKLGIADAFMNLAHSGTRLSFLIGYPKRDTQYPDTFETLLSLFRLFTCRKFTASAFSCELSDNDIAAGSNYRRVSMYPYCLIGLCGILLISGDGSDCIYIEDHAAADKYRAKFEEELKYCVPSFECVGDYMKLARDLFAGYKTLGDGIIYTAAERPCIWLSISSSMISKHVSGPFAVFAEKYRQAFQKLYVISLARPEGLEEFLGDHEIYEAGVNVILDDDMKQINDDVKQRLGKTILMLDPSDLLIDGWETCVIQDRMVLLFKYDTADFVIRITSPELVHAFRIYYDTVYEEKR